MIIDRFEEDIAILLDEEGTATECRRRFLPAECREGDVLKKVNGMWQRDTEETQRRTEKIAALLRKLHL